MKALSSAILLLLAATTASAAESTKKAPPPFFLQDPKDSQCLGGEDFRRCSIDTLWYVVGAPGESALREIFELPILEVSSIVSIDLCLPNE
jgi:hypothetical protein